MSSEPGRSSESRSRRPLRVATVGGVLLVLLASLGCGLKGDPLPPIRPPDPVTEAEADADAAETESEDAESAEDTGEEPEAEDGGSEDDEDSEEDGDDEEDGGGAQRPR